MMGNPSVADFPPHIQRLNQAFPNARPGMPRNKRDPVERFFKNVVKDNCWVWMGERGPLGYGRFHFNGRRVQAHRWSYVLAVGIPEQEDIDHLCRNPSCVNPAHLEAVSHAENIRRGMAPVVSRERQLSKTHCPKGHPYEGDNLVLKNGGKNRQCRECRRAQWRAWNARRSA